MTVLSILGCKMLQDEIVWLITNDSQIKRILIVENRNIFEFTEKLDEQHICYSTVPLKKLAQVLRNIDKDELTLVINLMELGLHAVPKKLKSEVYQSVSEMIPFSNGILVFYGLCGNVLGNIEEDFSQEKSCIVRILRDSKRVVDDCIGATVGGGENYLKLLKTHSKEPAFFFTPMYACSWRELLSIDKLHSDPAQALKKAKKINDLAGYSRVAKVNTGLLYVKDIDEKIEEYAKLFGYSIFEIEGNQDIFKECYLSIKDAIINSH